MERKEYQIRVKGHLNGHWSEWLGESEIISTSQWTVETGLTKDSDSKTDSTTTIWLSGGTAGTEYTVTNSIVTNGGREDDRSFIIKVMDR